MHVIDFWRCRLDSSRVRLFDCQYTNWKPISNFKPFTKSSNSIHLIVLAARAAGRNVRTFERGMSTMSTSFSPQKNQRENLNFQTKNWILKADLLPAFSTFVNLQEESAKKLQFFGLPKRSRFLVCWTLLNGRHSLPADRHHAWRLRR